MNETGSITEFFYNIVPGGLFLLFLNYIYKINIAEKLLRISNEEKPDSAIIIFIFIIGGLFVGFFFQCFTKIFRSKLLNSLVFEKVKKSNCEEFDQICVYIFGNDYKKRESLDVNKSFYLMDNALRGQQPAFLATHFSSRFAFWANIAWGSFF